MRWQKSKKFLSAFIANRFIPFIWLIHTGWQTTIRPEQPIEMATKRRPSMRQRMKAEDVSCWVEHNKPIYTPQEDDELKHYVRFDVPQPKRTDDESSDSRTTIAEVPIYHDGGYGWFVVFCSFIMHAICDGASFCFGILFVTIQKHFKTNRVASIAAASLFLSLPLCLSPIAGITTDILGCRAAILIGASICTISCALSIFSTNIWFFTVTFGFGCGVGMSFIYNGAICIVTYYFNKKRGLATSLAVAGTGCGTFVFPLYIAAAITCFKLFFNELQSILLAFTFAYFLIGIIGYVIKDVEWQSDTEEFKRQQFEKNSKRLREDLRNSLAKKEIGKIRRAISLPTLKYMKPDSGSIQSLCDLGTDGKGEKPTRSKSVAAFENQHPSMPTIPEYSMLNTRLANLEHLDLELANSPCTTVKAPRRRVLSKVSMSVDQINELDEDDFKVNLLLSSTDSSEKSDTESSSDDSEMSNDGDSSSSELSEKMMETTTTLKNKNLAVATTRAASSVPSSARLRTSLAPGTANVSGGRIMAGNAIQSQSRYASNLLTMGKIPSAPMLIVRKKRKHMIDKMNLAILKRMTENEIPVYQATMKNHSFRYLVASVIFLYLVLDVPYVCFYDYALEELHIPENTASAIYSVIGSCNFVSTIVYGKLSDFDTDHKFIPHLYSASMIGVSFTMVSAMFAFAGWQLIGCGAFFGIFVTANYVLQTIMITNCFDEIHMFQGAYSLIGMVEGIASLVGPPIFAFIREMTGSYHAVFILGGVCAFFSAVFAFLYTIEKRKEQVKDDVEAANANGAAIDGKNESADGKSRQNGNHSGPELESLLDV
ncbi:unnamed protein product [Caenorhabditis sp. 36 PRJEB53466]|nr:unnamed protein product [Caenorhabditis sp. 36 PRJEB53466]